MICHVVRYKTIKGPRWGYVEGDSVFELDFSCETTADLIQGFRGEIRAAVSANSGAMVGTLDELDLLSPVTDSCRVLCQGANYREHMRESGMDPDKKKFNMFFMKSSAAISPPHSEIRRPAHVELLDYEVELALVLGRNTEGAVDVNPANLHEFVAGICVGNDVSARDVQIPQMQFFKGKSYRTFLPLGPILCLLDAEDMFYLDEMFLQLKVNGETRQKDHSGNLVFDPAETLTESSRFTDFAPGDVLMTGTPAGCALGLPSPTAVRLASLLPEALKWKIFLKSQKKRPGYLQPGDKLETAIFSRDGRVNLGAQRNTVTAEVAHGG